MQFRQTFLRVSWKDRPDEEGIKTALGPSISLAFQVGKTDLMKKGLRHGRGGLEWETSELERQT